MTTGVKICGISQADALDAALGAQADYIGLVFYEPSPRYVAPAAAAALADRARKKAKIVALVVDAEDVLLDEIAAQVSPDFIQAHGREGPQRLREMVRRTGIPAIKAIKVASEADIARADDFADSADMILFDAKAPETLRDALPGGNGIAFDWSLLDGRGERRFMLSGGLDAANVAEAVRLTGAPIVDVSSGVEVAPGVKDPALIRNFVVAARAAG